MNPIQKGVLYTLPQPTSPTLLNVLDKLKSSLWIALTHFYPLSGRFDIETFDDGHVFAVSIDCNKGPGARLAHVKAKDITVSNIVSPVHIPVIVSKFFDLGESYMNYDCHTRPLLSIQVTELVDGFLSGFRCAIRETKPLRDRVFYVSSKSLAMIKAKANQGDSIIPNNVSSFQSLISLIWRSITKARNLSADEETSCNLTINSRFRVDPPKSYHYFGSYVAQVKVTCTVGELLGHDLGRAAKRLNEGIKAQDDKSISGALNMFGDLVNNPDFFGSETNVLGLNNVITGGSTRFNMYGLEFGLGKPIAGRMGPGNRKDGKINLSQGREGGGSVDLEITLTEDVMTNFEADHDFMAFVS
ncbi:hypothetical protein RND81_09G167300 [Saponaria officinalis]|uniref:Uncharacterized protein n=1 Tax=Saponaria officinalis TaxID=3572 RepID=A0AAW1ILM5_SAPOF